MTYLPISRSRKIRCDSARPTCNNCVRRANVCEYDTQTKRRGPDKKPGTRKRSCKKRPPPLLDTEQPTPERSPKRKKMAQNVVAIPTTGDPLLGSSGGYTIGRLPDEATAFQNMVIRSPVVPSHGRIAVPVATEVFDMKVGIIRLTASPSSRLLSSGLQNLYQAYITDIPTPSTWTRRWHTLLLPYHNLRSVIIWKLCPQIAPPLARNIGGMSS
jgi:hypothetical protein